MLLVTVFRDSQGYIAALEADGHVGFASIGTDIACAGASAVIQTAILGCIKLLGITPGQSLDDGYLYFSCPSGLDQNIEEKIQLIFDTMLLGLKEIQLKYPDLVKITEERI